MTKPGQPIRNPVNIDFANRRTASGVQPRRNLGWHGRHDDVARTSVGAFSDRRICSITDIIENFQRKLDNSINLYTTLIEMAVLNAFLQATDSFLGAVRRRITHGDPLFRICVLIRLARQQPPCRAAEDNAASCGRVRSRMPGPRRRIALIHSWHNPRIVEYNTLETTLPTPAAMRRIKPP